MSRSPGRGYAALSTNDASGSGGDSDEKEASPSVVGTVALPAPPTMKAPQAPALPPRSRSSSCASNASVPAPAVAAETTTSGSAAAAVRPSTDVNGNNSSVVAARPPPSPVSRAASAPLAPPTHSRRPSSSSVSGGPRSSSGGDKPAEASPGAADALRGAEKELWIGGGVGANGGGGSRAAGREDRSDGDGYFHDAQDVLMPTLSVYDPERLWEYVERPMMVYMPLRKLSARPPAVSSPMNIDELPVRCLVHRTLAGTEVASRLVDSPAERYRASFAFIYMVSAESQEHYKQTVRPLVREWVDKVEARGGGADGGGWLLLYVIVAPQGSGSSTAAAAAAAAVEAQGKIFWWLCADFYSKTPGDRCSLVSLYVDQGAPNERSLSAMRPRPRPSASPRHHPKQWSDLLAKVGRIVLEVFEARVACYTAELSRLDSTRGMIGWDFGEFFVVKESLALMFKELQLPAEALLKYQELAALILTMGEDAGSLSRSSSIDSGGGDAGRESGAKELLFGLGVADQPDRIPASVLDYGRMRFRERVNGGRLHSLVLETQLYIFARQCALNLELKRPAEVARMGGRFMPAYYHELVGQAEDRAGDDEYSSPRERQASASASSLDPIEVELFAFKSSWDVVKSCDRYFARALRPNGLEPPTRELIAIRQARAETSRHLSELLEFAQTRLLEYARLVAEDGIARGMASDGSESDVSASLMSSCVWELQERGFLASQRDWVPQQDGNFASNANARREAGGGRSGRMRVDGGVIEVKTMSGQYFWDPDEEGEVFLPPQEGGSEATNPIKALTGGDGVPSPRRAMKTSSLMADFDDEDSDETEESAGLSTTTTTATAAAAASAAGSATSDIVAAVATAARPLLRSTTSSSNSIGASSAKNDSTAGNHEALGHRLDHPDLLEDAYLQLTHSLAQHNQRAGRVRAAARCWAKRAELLLERGEVGVAQARLSALADLYQTEGWLPQAFWALHRLARCRRTLASAAKESSDAPTRKGTASGKYISTVMRMAALLKDPRVRSGGGMAAVETAAAALLRDAHAVASGDYSLAATAADTAINATDSSLTSDVAAGQAYRLQCFAEAKVAVVLGGGHEANVKNRIRLRNPGTLPATHVGDTIQVSCVLTSHLPEAVTLDDLELEMVYEGRYSSGEIENQRANHRRATTAAMPTAAARRKSFRRMESVATISGLEDNESGDVDVSAPAGNAPPTKFRPPPPVVTATNALTLSLADGDGVIGPAAAAAADGDLIADQIIAKTRSQSLSPRSKSSSSTGMFTTVGGAGGEDESTAPGRAGRSRTPMRLARGSQPTAGPGPTAPLAAPASRLPRHHRSRAICSARVDGPVEVLPGETEVIFVLRPVLPGIMTASKISAVWGAVRLVEVLPSGGRGAGASTARLSGVVAEPPAWLGTPCPPPSAVVRPFRPQAALEVLPPPFLPAGCGGWVRLVVCTGPDKLRSARLRLLVGPGLAWGAAALARILTSTDGSDGNGGEEAQALASTRDGPAEIFVDLPEVLEPGRRADVWLRVLSTAAAAPGGADVPTFGFAATRKPSTVKAEMQASHYREPAGEPSAETANAGKNVDEIGVDCRIRARTSVVANLPFEARATVMSRPGGVVLAEAALVCRAPVALTLRSCEIADVEDGTTVIADPNKYLSGEVLPPEQPLRLAACLRRARSGAASVMSPEVAGENEDGGPVPLAVLKLRYTIQPPAESRGGSSARDSEEFVFDVAIPVPEARNGGGSTRSLSTAGRFSNGQPPLSVTTFVEPVDDGMSSRSAEDGASGGSPLQLKLAEPRAFDFGVEVDEGGSNGAGQLVTFRVATSRSNWMVSGLVRGSARLGAESKQRKLCRVHLVPIRSGLLPLPRLEITAAGGDDNVGNIEVWTPEERKVLVLPAGDSTSVCHARPP